MHDGTLAVACGAAGNPGNDCGSHRAVFGGTLAVACDAAGDPGNDCGSHPAMDDGTLAVACDAAGDPGNDCGSHIVSLTVTIVITDSRQASTMGKRQHAQSSCLATHTEGHEGDFVTRTTTCSDCSNCDGGAALAVTIVITDSRQASTMGKRQHAQISCLATHTEVHEGDFVTRTTTCSDCSNCDMVVLLSP
jgi:hypothetical protein